MIIRKDIDLKQTLTSEQKKMLEELKSRDVHPDEDAPELTQEQLQQLHGPLSFEEKNVENNP